ncbi:MAG TPA: AAA family ATPase, partial [Chloroflexia bacterium]|nr:AAA family ATPase [Chloroflexia bacterium]
MSRAMPVSNSNQGDEPSLPDGAGEGTEARAVAARVTPLPVQFTPFVGRERESAAVRQLLLRGDVRLLTLVGPPGIGKTRLAIQVAAGLPADFRDGVHFVSLGPIRDPALIIPAIAETVGVRETAGEPLLVTLQTYLKDRAALLVLDNFEHVAEAGQHVADLLSECAHVKALVTSRELLHLYGEQDYPVPPLSLPDPGKSPDLDSLSEYEAVALFVQRARAVDPGFQLTEQNARAVAEVCVQLDGLPLAIELAAARVLVLRPEELPARLKSRLKLLTGGARNLPERQRTIRAAIEWSYNLLEPGEQALFRGLGVFAGGCTVDAIEQVCGGSDPQIEAFDGVTSLVGKSLLQRQAGAEWAGGAEPRFVMLETIREFAREKLGGSGELDATCDRHLDYFTQIAERSDQETLGGELPLWMRRLDADQNNMRAALEWSLTGNDRAGGRRAVQGLRLVGALGRYWQFRSYLSEGRQWCALLLDKTEPAGPSVDRARALRALARFEFELSDSVEARRLYEQSLAISRALGDGQGEAATLLG